MNSVPEVQGNFHHLGHVLALSVSGLLKVRDG